jgi:uncharacterized protein (TIGR02246 family)
MKKARKQTTEPQDDDAEEAIMKVVAEMTEGFNKHDAKAATRMYRADADFVSVRGEAASGAAEIERRLEAIFASRAKKATLKTREVRIKLVRHDVAIVHVVNELSGLIGSDGQELPAHQELSIRVLVKDGGAWCVAAFHNTMRKPF